MRVGVDTGGTFTDVVTADGAIAKVPSTRADLAAAVAAGVPADTTVLAHGTTIATNALLERRGGRVALFTTAGMTDVIEIARQDRPSLYDQLADRPGPLVERAMRLEVDERIAADGSVLRALDPAALPPVPRGTEAVAVVLLHADLDPSHEQEAAAALRDRGIDVTASSEISPEFREYERTVTTVLNAYLRPPCRAYLGRLAELADEVLVMTSAGGLVPLADAGERAVALLLSGPAGGVLAAAAAATAAGFPDCVTFDMGGTSTDVCLVRQGRPEPAAERSVAGLPVRLPSLDIHTIGAGGGSIARIDPGGALVVGPESAGAEPGPACFGRGGTAPTVTDANLLAGRIEAGTAFPGLPALDTAAAERALATVGVAAEDVLRVVDAAMVQAIRSVTVERGVDPRDLALVAFGGAGPLHACALAEELGMAAVVVPPRAGVLSAVGMLCASRQADLVRSWPLPSEHDGIDDALLWLAAAASRQLGGGAVVDVALDCRYRGQSHELTVAAIADFHEEHRRRNGYSRPDEPVEVVALRARAVLPPEVAFDDLPAAAPREAAVGPVVLSEPDCTVWVPSGWTAEVGGGGAWILRRSAS